METCTGAPCRVRSRLIALDLIRLMGQEIRLVWTELIRIRAEKPGI